MSLPDPDALEKIVTCPIHIGILENPRVLLCGHVLCKTCLEAILARNIMRCPVCMADIQSCEDFRPCYVLSQISLHLMEQSIRSQVSLIRDTDAVQQKTKTTKKAESRHQKSISKIRQSMTQMASYRAYYQTLWKNGSPTEMCCIAVDPVSSYLFLLNDRNGSIFRCAKNGRDVTTFNLGLDNEEVFLPHFLKCSKAKIYVSGILHTRQKDPVGILLLADSNGVILKRSMEFPFHPDPSAHPTVSGFDIDRDSGEVAVVCPNSHSVFLLDINLEEIDSYIIDDTMAPYFIARSLNNLWITCPGDGRILLIDISTGHLEYLFANEIFDCVPSHIVCTTDNRIIMLDSQEPRVFWLERSQENMIVQKLDLGKELKNKEILSISAMAENHILVATRHGASFLKPHRLPFHQQKRKSPPCALL